MVEYFPTPYISLYFIDVFSVGVAALISVAVMAFERYAVVCKPFGPVHFSERTATIGMILSEFRRVSRNKAIFENGLLLLRRGIYLDLFIWVAFPDVGRVERI